MLWNVDRLFPIGGFKCFYPLRWIACLAKDFKCFIQCFNVATVTNLQYNDDGRLPDYHAQSHGESFLSFLQDEAREGVYLMDEPEAALSPQRQLTLMLHIHSMALEGSQFIIATHSPILLGLPEARILSFTDAGIHPICYEDTESYQITKLFLEQRESLLNKLFNGAED